MHFDGSQDALLVAVTCRPSTSESKKKKKRTSQHRRGHPGGDPWETVSTHGDVSHICTGHLHIMFIYLIIFAYTVTCIYFILFLTLEKQLL